MTDSQNPTYPAYKNPAFIDHREGRPLRILAEYMEPDSRLDAQNVEDTIVFIGSARLKSKETAEAEYKKAVECGVDVHTADSAHHMSKYYEAARELSRRLTDWSKKLEGNKKRFVVCTGGGPGIMEAGNRGASEAKGLNMGLNISLPFEQHHNPYITHQLSFDFKYFFMRKFWFMYMAKAMIAFPGGFGTMDELFEALTLIQTGKVTKKLPIVMFGKEFWEEVMDLNIFVKYGTISPQDLDLLYYTDSVDEAFDYITAQLEAHALHSGARSHDPAP